jgi:hypothetical protein
LNKKTFLELLGESLSKLKEADITAKMGDSFDSLSCAVRNAINANIVAGIDMDADDDGAEDAAEGQYAWVVDLFPKLVVYSIGGNYYQCSWKRGADGTVALGKPQPVEKAWITSDKAVEESSKKPVLVVGGNREVFRQVASLTESGAAYDKSKGILTVKVIQPGFNKSKERFYPSETLKRDFSVFKGAKMFADHQTESEQQTRPEGSVNNWVASLNNVWVESDGTIMGEAVVIDPPFKAKLDALNEKGLLSEMGVSIRAIGEASVKEIEGTRTKYVESFLASRSVDFVTYAGAGGKILAIESSSLADENDVDLISESDFRTRRPDIVAALESKLKETALKTIEEQLRESQTENAQLKAKVATMEKDSNKKVAAVELSKLLSESKLPEVAAKRIEKQFAEAENTEGMKEAIDGEVAYIKSLAPIKKHNGAEDNADTTNESNNKGTKPNLVESFQKLGLSEAAAKIAAGV